MSKIKNGGLDQYGAELFEQQQFGTAGVAGGKRPHFLFSANGSSIMSFTRLMWCDMWRDSSTPVCKMWLNQVHYYYYLSAPL